MHCFCLSANTCQNLLGPCQIQEIYCDQFFMGQRIYSLGENLWVDQFIFGQKTYNVLV